MIFSIGVRGDNLQRDINTTAPRDAFLVAKALSCA